MRALRHLAKCFLIAGGIWLADSLFLAFFYGEPLLAALWIGVNRGHLMIFRLIPVLTVLLFGVTKILRQETEYQKVVHMRPARREALYGSADSPDKSLRLLYHALRLSALLQMNKNSQDALRKLCYCYDMGFIGSNEEGRAALGAQIAAGIPQLANAAKLIACQQEYYDGNGLRSLRGKRIPLACRIFTAALLFDDLTHGKKKMTPLEALDELELYSGTRLDPDVLAAFRRLYTEKRILAEATARVYVQ